ncbi:MAG: hypothetical protein ACOC3V_02980, partial [bacterium]
MCWNVLIIPSGYRYKVKLGEGTNLDKMKSEYDSIKQRAKIKFVCKHGINPDKLSYGNSNLQKELNQEINNARKQFSKKYKTDLVPNKMLEMIKSTEPDHLDIIVDLDVDSQEDFGMKYDSDEQGTLDILSD